MASFDNLLKGIHSGVQDTATINDNYIMINEQRKFVPVEFDTTIAFEGDINSQKITFKLPKLHENHELSNCANKKIRWKNLSSGVEGNSNLQPSELSEQNWFYSIWEVPSELFTSAGTIEISISLFDHNNEDTKDYVVFSWNTATYTGLSVGKSMETVGFSFPAKNEILVVDNETKNIIAPTGYNNIICNYGEVGVSEVYFLINRYLGKTNKFIDVMNESTNISLYITMNGLYGASLQGKDIVKKLYTSEIEDRNNEGLVFITWNVPAGVTAGPAGPNPMSIMLGIEQNGKKWFSNVYTSLKVGNSMFATNGQPSEEWDLMEDYVKDIIDQYIDSNDFIIDSNT